MNTHGYLNIHGYPHSGYPRGYRATSIIFIQPDMDGYHTIRIHGYPLTFLSMTTKEIFHIVVETFPMHPVQAEDFSTHDTDMDEKHGEKHGEDQRRNIPDICIYGPWCAEVINIDYGQDYTQVEN